MRASATTSHSVPNIRFSFVIILTNNFDTLNKCGNIHRQRGVPEVSLEGCHYHIEPGGMFISIWLLPWCTRCIRVKTA